MKIYDAGKVIAGLIIFFVVFTFPVYYNHGKVEPAPKPSLETEKIQSLYEKNCVEDKATMRSGHMLLLDKWRDTVVRDRLRSYAGFKGTRFEMSLSNTCMDCHSNKEQFCDACHNYAGVTPYCWECHLTPKEMK
ncbi:MAG: sulfate reduction electron transfer complex DsrMKJOP subunit DsrJ [Deltaproteobacteria bacterium]|nr:sulfate reduction electron transfer complex DsrMKJOP subunit DsrJ [Deltaproteobacteria bacterium]